MLRRLAFIFLISVLPTLANADPLDNWHWRNPLPQGNTLKAVTYGNGIFVAVGDGGIVITSPNGSNWSVASAGNCIDLNSAAFGNGTFVAVGYSGKIVTSTDGSTWTAAASGTTSHLNSVIYAKGQFTTVGDDGAVLISSDGIEWTVFSSGIYSYPPFEAPPYLDPLVGIAYGNNTYIAVSYGKIITSPNGTVWTVIAEHNLKGFSLERLLGVAFANNTFVAVGQAGYILTSHNGTDWAWAITDTREPLYAALDINGILVAVGTRAVCTSIDGNTWTTVLSAPIDLRELRALAFGNGTLVAVGSGGIILKSSDAITWTPGTNGATNGFNGISYGNGIFVAVGNTILTSQDGVTWTKDASDNHFLSGVVYGKGIFIAVGQAGKILTSSDGLAWTAVSSGTTEDLHGIVYVSDTFTAVGSNGTILSSFNGIDWSIIPTGVSYDLYGIAYGNNTFVAVGRGTPSTVAGPIITSADGSTWATSYAYRFTLNAITYGKGLFVAGTLGGGIITSSDGTHWANVPSLGSFLSFFWGTAYLHDTFVMDGNGRLFTSTDGMNWTSVTKAIFGTGAAGNINTFFISRTSAAYGNNTIVVVGANGAILQSDPLSGSCTATLSSSLSLSMPIVDFSGGSLSADMEYVTDADMFRVTRVDMLSNTDVWSDCLPASLNNDPNNLKLHIPAVKVGNLYYSADLEYIPSTDNQIWFRATKAEKL